jgi:hypothetical protein
LVEEHEELRNSDAQKDICGENEFLEPHVRLHDWRDTIQVLREVQLQLVKRRYRGGECLKEWDHWVDSSVHPAGHIDDEGVHSHDRELGQ